MPRKPAIASSKRAVAARLQREDAERDDGGHQAGDERRHAEQQVERDRGADELGEVGRDGDRPRPAPRARASTRPREVLAAQLRAGCGRWRCRSWPTGTGRASPSGSRRRSPRRAGSRTWRRRRCSWRSCRGRCRRRRRRTPGRAARARRAPGRGPRAAQRLTPRAAGGRRRLGDGSVGVGRRRHARHLHAHRRGERRRRATWTSSPKRTNSGPPNGWRSTTSNASPGAIPRSAR